MLAAWGWVASALGGFGHAWRVRLIFAGGLIDGANVNELAGLGVCRRDVRRLLPCGLAQGSSVPVKR